MGKQPINPINELHPDRELANQFPWEITATFLLAALFASTPLFLDLRWLQYALLILSVLASLATLLLVFEARRRRPFLAARQAAAFDRYDNYLYRLTGEEEVGDALDVQHQEKMDDEDEWNRV